MINFKIIAVINWRCGLKGRMLDSIVATHRLFLDGSDVKRETEDNKANTTS